MTERTAPKPALKPDECELHICPDYWHRGFVVYGQARWPSHAVWFVPGLCNEWSIDGLTTKVKP